MQCSRYFECPFDPSIRFVYHRSRSITRQKITKCTQSGHYCPFYRLLFQSELDSIGGSTYLESSCRSIHRSPSRAVNNCLRQVALPLRSDGGVECTLIGTKPEVALTGDGRSFDKTAPREGRPMKSFTTWTAGRVVNEFSHVLEP